MTPQDAYPGGQAAHAVPIAYCPRAQMAVGVGVSEGVAATLCVGVCDAVAATSSRRAWWVGVLVGVSVALGDLLGVGYGERDIVGLRVGALDEEGLRVDAPDLVELPVA